MPKQETISHMIEFWQRETVNWQSMDDSHIKNKLSSIKGIGQWTIDMVLLYTLGRTSIFPVDDFHLKQVMVALYGLDPAKGLRSKMLEVSKLWQNQESLAVLYLLEWKAYQRTQKKHEKSKK
jgi:DNA-3-methyladenine glycosylase II